MSYTTPGPGDPETWPACAGHPDDPPDCAVCWRPTDTPGHECCVRCAARLDSDPEVLVGALADGDEVWELAGQMADVLRGTGAWHLVDQWDGLLDRRDAWPI